MIFFNFRLLNFQQENSFTRNTIEMEVDLLYRAEYSKSNRASCKGCKITIPKDVVRIARMVQVSFVPNVSFKMIFFRIFILITKSGLRSFFGM